MKRASKLIPATTTISVESCGAKASKIARRGSKPPPASKTKEQRQHKKLKAVDSGITKSSLLGAEDPLVSLGALCQGRILRRPSQHIKSPYVADVKLDPEFGGAEVSLSISLISPFSIQLLLSSTLSLSPM